MPKNNILVVNANDFFQSPAQVASQIYEFLDMPPCDPLPSTELNPTEPFPVSPAFREELSAFFQPYNERLYDFLQQDFAWH